MKKLLSLVVLGIAVKLFLESESGKTLKRQLQDCLAEVQDWLGDTVDAVKTGADPDVPKMG